MYVSKYKARRFAVELKIYDWFVKEMEQYVKDGDLTREQADLQIEDLAERLDCGLIAFDLG